MKGTLIFHAAGIVRNKKGYLFLGRSGAGKSTICNLSKKTQVIDDDTVYLAKIKARACIYNPHNQKFYKIRRIFIIFQSKSIRIKKASITEVLRFMLEDSVIAFRNNSSVGLSRKSKYIFNFVMDMLHSATCHKLCFKKKGGFWKVIDKLECNYKEPYAKDLIRTI
ncbi:hypothetical protein D4R78_02155 [bacterium]|nr:MAG: hypothetical protein D4R78_02155 [bacterium]